MVERFPRRDPLGTTPPRGAAALTRPLGHTGAMTTTATGHRATVAQCRCGLPLGGEGLDPSTDPEPADVRTVTVLGQVPGVARFEREHDGLWHTPRTRYQQPGPPLPWAGLGVCALGRRHRVVAVGQATCGRT